MCNLYSITTNQAAIAALFRVVNRYVGNLAPMPGVFPDYPAPLVRNTDVGTEMVTMRVLSGGKRYEVDTVKGGAKRDTKGSAQAKVQRSGSGATVTVAAVASSGEKIAGTIKCGGLTPMQAEGG